MTARPRLLASALTILSAGLAASAAAQSAQDAAPALSFFGGPGHVSLPSAFALPDGVFAFSFVQQGEDVRRGTMVFQITPRLSGSFRYSYLQGYLNNASEYSLYDRSFDMAYQIAVEDPNGWRPAITLGFQDFGGTGVYSSEYLVASRHFGSALSASAGIGWGRLGSYNSFSNPLSVISDRFDRRPWSTTTGRIEFNQFFRGPAALFFGMDWQVSDRLRLSAEYSSDAMRNEVARLGYEHRSPVNLGLEYKLANGGELGLAYMNGSTFALGYSLVIDPRQSASPSGREAGPPPVMTGSRETVASWGNPVSDSRNDRLAAALNEQGIRLIGVTFSGDTAVVSVENEIWPATAQGWGRSMRVLSDALPAEITRFRLQSQRRGMPLRSVTLNRSDLEELEFAPDGAWQVWSRAQSLDALHEGREGRALAYDPALTPDPDFTYGLTPYLEQALFDPDNPLRIDFGAQLMAEWSPVQGLYFSGALRQKLAGNMNESTRLSNSILPHVRSDSALYFKDEGPRLPWLTAEYFLRPAEDLYGRFTIGLLETMYAGASAELLWAPVDRKLSLGIEINQLRKRDYSGTDLLDYSVTSGHVSAYYAFGNSYYGQLDLGRYLAGDLGATATFTRRFDNGFEIGAFATLTDVSFKDFGEGSFDKGITLRMPVTLLTGQPSLTQIGTTIRPIQRDGGARVMVRNRLFELIRDEREAAQGKAWARFWR